MPSLKAIATAVLIGASSLVCQAHDIKIKFHKWDGWCGEVEEAGDAVTIHDGKCENMDHRFDHFAYEKTFIHTWLMPWDDNDFDEPTCQVIVFPEWDCTGTGYTPGMAKENLEDCHDVPMEIGGTAWSAMVVCDTLEDACQGLVKGNPLDNGWMGAECWN